MGDRRRTRTLPTRQGPFVRRSDVLALLQREHDAAIERGDGADLLVRVECRGVTYQGGGGPALSIVAS